MREARSNLKKVNDKKKKKVELNGRGSDGGDKSFLCELEATRWGVIFREGGLGKKNWKGVSGEKKKKGRMRWQIIRCKKMCLPFSR